MRAKYICLEGTEGVGKSTQTDLLVRALTAKGHKVLQTKEPGTIHAPLTMILRKIMLDGQYDEQMAAPARELISQAIRSIHLEKVVVPALTQYDFIVQDRGILTGLAYGEACGNDSRILSSLADFVSHGNSPYSWYDHVIYLKGDVKKHLEIAKGAKQEFAAGDVMEARGDVFMQQVRTNMDFYAQKFNTSSITVDGMSIDDVHSEILYIILSEKT